MRVTTILPASVLLSLALSGCGGYSMGASPGGMQDMNYARELIAAGLIPSRDDYTDEGLFSEHDLPLEGDPCAETLCPRAAAAWIDPVDASSGEALVQVGFATDVDPDTFQRDDLELVVAIDVSGSMEGDKLRLSKQALHAVVAQLGPRDTMTLVEFDDHADVVRQATAMDADGRAAMDRAIDDLRTRGGTAMEDGLSLAYAQVQGLEGTSGRVLLMTDAQPNIGATGPESFMGLARRNHEAAGLTVFGVGMDLGSELMNALSTVRGANGFSFFEPEDMVDKIDDEFDLFVTPVAYDLDISAEPIDGMRLSRAWGTAEDAASDRVQIGASTLFLSRNDGAIGLSLVPETLRSLDLVPAPDPGVGLAALSVSWTPAAGGARVETAVDVAWTGEPAFVDSWASADQLGVYKLGALADEILALDAGADWCAGRLDADEAERRIAETAERLASRASTLRDAGLTTEAELIDQLLVNFRERGECHGGDVSTFE